MYCPQKSRLDRLQQSLRRRKIDALLVSQPDNRRYLSGYTAPDHGIQETAGFLLIPASDKPILLTDSRFTLQAEAEAPLFTVDTYRKGLLKSVEKQCRRLGVKTLAFESEYFLYATFLRLSKMAAAQNLELKAESGLVEKMRAVKDERELDLIRRSTALNEQVFQSVYQTIEPGMSEREIALALELTMREMGAEGPSFDTIVAFGTNAAKPHAVPTDRVLQAGDLVLIDMGLILDGYCSDMTRTFVAGKPDPIFIERHRAVRKAMLAGINAIRAGVTGVEGRPRCTAGADRCRIRRDIRSWPGAWGRHCRARGSTAFPQGQQTAAGRNGGHGRARALPGRMGRYSSGKHGHCHRTRRRGDQPGYNQS